MIIIIFIMASEAQMYVKHKHKRLYSDSEQKYTNKGSTEMLYNAVFVFPYLLNITFWSDATYFIIPADGTSDYPDL